MTPTAVVSRSIQQRLTATLFLAQSLFSAAVIVSFTVTPIVAADLSGSDSLAGVPSTVILLGRALAAYPIGWLMDRVGRRFGFSLGYLFAVIGSIISALAVIGGAFLTFCLGAALIGMGRGASEQTRFAAAEVYEPERRAKVIGLIVFAGTIGAVVGPLLADFSSDLALRLSLEQLSGPYLVSGVLVAVGMVLTLVMLRPDPKEIGRLLAARYEDSSAMGRERPLREVFANKMVQLALAAMVIGQLVMTLVMVITPLHMDHHEHTVESISIVIMAHTLGMFGLSSLTGWLIDHYGRIAMIVVGACILIVAALLTPVSTAVSWLALALFLLGLGWNFCFIAGSSLLSDTLAAHERGRIQGANEVMVALASGMGSLGTGIVFDQGGITAVSAVVLAFILALVGITILLGRGRHPIPAGS